MSRLQRPRVHGGQSARQRGLSLVELMVGITISLFILAGATMVASTQLADNRKMLLETQIQQDLRATVDVISRDLRRAGYWGQAWRNVWPANGTLALDNPYNAVTATATSIEFNRSQDEAGKPVGTDDNQVGADERAGFRFNAANKTVDVLVSAGNWQALTDPNVLEVTAFSITLTRQAVPAPCSEGCPLGPGIRPLQLCVRDAAIEVRARATHDASIQRSLRTDIRLRNDVLAEVC